MQDLRVDVYDFLYGFHRFRSQGSKFDIGQTKHHVFKRMKNVSDLRLNIEQLHDISSILHINKVSPSDPGFLALLLFCMILKQPVLQVLKLLAQGNSIPFIVVQLLLVESLLTSEDKSKRTFKSKIVRLVLSIELFEFFMKGEQLMISNGLLVEATLKAGVILARYLHVYAPQVKKSVTAAALDDHLRLLLRNLILFKLH